MSLASVVSKRLSQRLSIITDIAEIERRHAEAVARPRNAGRLRLSMGMGPVECGRGYVFREAHPLRMMWTAIMVALLLYTATIFPFRLAFLDFKIIGTDKQVSQINWDNVDWATDILFWIDLMWCFFFSYRDDEGREVMDLRRVACHYFTTSFALNLVASIPSNADDLIVPLFGSYGTQIVPLLRLVRLVRLFKLVSFMTNSPFWRWLQNMKGVQLFNFTLGFFGVVHMMACGWYLCAALHKNQEETWIGRRMVYSDTGIADTMLLDVGSVEQWFHSMYFVLVVFTTVGFGDISATTIGEIIFVCSMMVIGAVVHSILVSRMIHVITNADQESSELANKRALISRFAEHVELDLEYQKDLVRCVKPSKGALEGYDQDQIRKLITTGLPELIMVRLHELMFQGRLASNRFMTLCSAKSHHVPARFPLIIAAMVQTAVAQSGEMLYYWRDHAWSIYLIISGTLAYVAKPHANGGICEISLGADSSPSVQTLFPYLLFGTGNYVGEFEILLQKPRACSLRCEAESQMLVLAKADFLRLVEEFPDYGALWKDLALRREGHRKAALKKLKRGRKFQDFAAITIQRYLGLRKAMEDPSATSAWTNSRSHLSLLEAKALEDKEAEQRQPDEQAADSLPTSALHRQEVIKAVQSQVQRLQDELDDLRREQQEAHSELMARLAILAAPPAPDPDAKSWV